MPRVLHVFHYPLFGGPHNEVLRIVHPLAERGYESAVLLPSEPGSAADRLRAGGIEVVQAPYYRMRTSRNLGLQARFAAGFAGDVGRIADVVRKQGADIVVGAGLINPQAALAARLRRRASVWKVVDTLAPRAVRLALTPIAARLSGALMFTGHGTLAAHGGRRTSGARAFVYYPPVDTERFRPSPERRQEARAALGIPIDAPVVGTVANITPQKGLEQFVRAAAIVARDLPECRFLIVGGSTDTHDAYGDRVRAEVQTSGVPAHRFIFTGYRADPESLYPAMDVKLLTARPRSEGVTTAVLEALACGVPVVATDVAALREAIEQGVTGALVPALDPHAAAAAVLALLSDPDALRRQGGAARRRAVDRFGLESCADTHARAFEAALAQRGRPKLSSLG